VKAIRDNAQDRIAVQDERLKRAAEEKPRTEKWAEREKAELKEQLNKAKAEMDALLKSEGIDLASLSIGKQLSDSANAVRSTAEALIVEMKEKLAQLVNLEKSNGGKLNSGWELTLAMGAMASGSFDDAAAHFDAYSKNGGQSWQASLSRGVAHANARGGSKSNLASLRAYNDAIALAPLDLDPDRKARMFGYRGAMLKRMNRLQEAESDLRIALTLANAEYERTDIHYNLSCIYAMRGEKENMLAEIQTFKNNRKYLNAVYAHRHDYFLKFANDPELVSAIQNKIDALGDLSQETETRCDLLLNTLDIIAARDRSSRGGNA